MKQKNTSCLIKLIRGFFTFVIFLGIIYIIADRYIYMPWQKFKHPQISDVRGIDVSKWQNNINWQKVGDAKISGDKISFVIIRATNGVRSDRKFYRNFRNARKQGFVCGAYHFWWYNVSPEKQARHYINTVKLRKGDFAPIVDLEEYPKNYDINKFHRNVLKWLDIIEKHYGVTPIIYANHQFKNKYLASEEFDRYPFWLAHYNVKKPRYLGDWKIWQYTKTGKVKGIKGNVDLDIFDGTYEDLLKLTLQ